MPTLTVQTLVSGLVGVGGSQTLTDDGAELANPTVLAAQAGTLTTRTDANTGTLTMSSGGHGIITGQRVDLYWSGGTRYGVTVGTVSGTSVPIDLGAGDNLPIATTAITVGIPESTAFSVTGDNVTALLLGVSRPVRARFAFADGGGDVAGFLVAAGGIYFWDGTGTNPLDSLTPTLIWMSHEDTTQSLTTLQAAALKH